MGHFVWNVKFRALVSSRKFEYSSDKGMFIGLSVWKVKFRPLVSS